MPVIRIPPEIVDKGLAVLVDEARSALAVWKGRGRIDLYDFSGTWHKTSHPYPREEEGLWSRDDVLGLIAEALASCDPPKKPAAPTGPTIRVDVDELSAAQLVRARPLAYALWNGRQSVEISSADGLRLRSVRVPAADLLTMSHLMHDILEVCDLVVELHSHGHGRSPEHGARSDVVAEHLSVITR
ncbi:MAG TPA: hypothetical protein VKR22_10400 [Acidimicrobiales bacterium]|nr:hypothetical protein [Acidimicrobiales bacterium]